MISFIWYIALSITQSLTDVLTEHYWQGEGRYASLSKVNVNAWWPRDAIIVISGLLMKKCIG